MTNTLVLFLASPAVLLAGLCAARLPMLLAVAFLIVSALRLHDAFPVLRPLQLPLGLALLTAVSLMLHSVSRTIIPYWSRSLTLFFSFSVFVVVSALFATNVGASLEMLNSFFFKMVMMTIAIVWLVREPKDLEMAGRLVVISGAAVALVAIKNKWSGIDLVEETRVTIGGDFGSSLADPNDLAFALLLPLSLAVALTLRGRLAVDKLLGVAAAAMLAVAVFYTESRGGFLGVGAIATVILVSVFRTKTVIAVVLAAGFLFWMSSGVTVRENEGAEASRQQRIMLLKVAARTVVRQPVLGVGPKNFPITAFNEVGKWKDHHNAWIGGAAELGLPAIALFGFLLARTLVENVKLAKSPQSRDDPVIRWTSLGTASALAGLSVSAFFLSANFAWPLYSGLALAFASARCGEEIRRSRTIQNSNRLLMARDG